MNWEKDLIKYRREKAAETLEVARILLQGKHQKKIRRRRFIIARRALLPQP